MHLQVTDVLPIRPSRQRPSVTRNQEGTFRAFPLGLAASVPLTATRNPERQSPPETAEYAYRTTPETAP